MSLGTCNENNFGRNHIFFRCVVCLLRPSQSDFPPIYDVTKGIPHKLRFVVGVFIFLFMHFPMNLTIGVVSDLHSFCMPTDEVVLECPRYRYLLYMGWTVLGSLVPDSISKF